MQRLMTEIGLTPVSRSRVNAKPATIFRKPWEIDPVEAYFA